MRRILEDLSRTATFKLNALEIRDDSLSASFLLTRLAPEKDDEATRAQHDVESEAWQDVASALDGMRHGEWIIHVQDIDETASGQTWIQATVEAKGDAVRELDEFLAERSDWKRART